MPNVNLTNDEYHALMTERTNATLVMGHCEDYPCCGHTPDDPCTREWYDHPDAFNPLVNPHCFCEHEYGICNVDYYDDEEPLDPDECEHGDWSFRTRHGIYRVTCDGCESDLVEVTDIHPRAYESQVIPGLWIEIPVLGTHMEVKS